MWYCAFIASASRGSGISTSFPSLGNISGILQSTEPSNFSLSDSKISLLLGSIRYTSIIIQLHFTELFYHRNVRLTFLPCVFALQVVIMRLICSDTFQLEEFGGSDVPRYAILLHTWGKEEVTLQDTRTDEAIKFAGYRKSKRPALLLRQTDSSIFGSTPAASIRQVVQNFPKSSTPCILVRRSRNLLRISSRCPTRNC